MTPTDRAKLRVERSRLRLERARLARERKAKKKGASAYALHRSQTPAGDQSRAAWSKARNGARSISLAQDDIQRQAGLAAAERPLVRPGPLEPPPGHVTTTVIDLPGA